MIVRGARIQVGADAKADRLEIRQNLSPSEPLCAIEGHVLEEVCGTALIVVFVQRPSAHDETKLGAFIRTRIPTQVVVKPVRERSRPCHTVRPLQRPNLNNSRIYPRG